MIPAIFVAAALGTGAAALFAARGWIRAAAYLVLVAAMLGLWWTALGKPRPALFGVPSGTVVSYALDEPKGIEVIVRPKGGGAPVLWGLPWNEAEAVALERAAREAKAAGRPLAVRGRGGGARSGYQTKRHAGPVFYPEPATQLPEKQRP